MGIYSSVDQLIGHTPLLELCRLEKNLGLSCRLLAKLEGMNPAGSAKDRVGLHLIEDAEARGALHPGSVVLECTSGNTGIGLAAVSAARGYHCIIVMPDNMSPERITLMRAYCAEVVLTPGALGMQGSHEKLDELKAQYPDAFVAGQFENPANPETHYLTTGPEIWDDTEGCVDAFVAGVGTGGTITGIGHYLKERNPEVHVVAVEPANSAVLSGGRPGPHNLQGIGGGFVPAVLDTAVYDEILPVTDEEAYAAARLLASCEGVLSGITSGAALHAALQLARREEFAGRTVVVLLPDCGDHYLSTVLYQPEN